MRLVWTAATACVVSGIMTLAATTSAYAAPVRPAAVTGSSGVASTEKGAPVSMARLKAAKAAALSAGAVTSRARGTTPAPRIGGGCNPYTNNGWNVSACISEAPGSVLRPDYYVNSWDSLPANCNIDAYEIDDTSGGVTYLSNNGCTRGHHGPWSTGLVKGHHYYTEVVVNSGDWPVADFESKVAIPGV